jgi:site-specific DNA-methyltransferase (adenine-specific)
VLKLNELYHMDCMEGMKQFPDGYFDLAIVDPPYGVGSVTYTPGTRISTPGGFVDTYNVVMGAISFNNRSTVKSKYLTDIQHAQNTDSTILGFGDENVLPPPEYFKELFRVSKNQVIWGGNYFLLPPSRGFVVWRKTNVPENFTLSMCEIAWTSFVRVSKYIECSAVQGAKQRFYPTQKPLKVYEFLLKHFAKPGDKILDTHAGSASSLVACHNTGFDYIGFEIDEAYYKAAKERLDNVRAQGRLFVEGKGE